jgi:hypothetical protein
MQHLEDVHLVGGRGPVSLDPCIVEKAFGLSPLSEIRNEHAGPFPAGPSGPSAAVGEGVSVLGQVGVDHHVHVGQIEATRRHVGRDEDRRTSRAEGFQRTIALGLRAITGDGGCPEAVVHEPLVQLTHTLARAAEQDRLGVARSQQHVHDRGQAVFGPHEVGHEMDVLVQTGSCVVAQTGSAVASGINALGVALVARSHPFDVARHGGREEQRPAFGGRTAEEVFEIVLESEIKHLVRLVEDQDTNGRKVQRLPAVQIHVPPRRSHGDVETGAQSTQVVGHVRAARERSEPQPGVGEQPLELLGDLDGQLTRGRDHQAARRHLMAGARPRESSVRQERIGHQSPEGHRLSRACLGGNQEVPPRQPLRQNGSLHGCRRLVSPPIEGDGQRRMHRKIFERSQAAHSSAMWARSPLLRQWLCGVAFSLALARALASASRAA